MIGLLRVLIGLILLVYTVMSALPLSLTIAHRSGGLPEDFLADADQTMIALMDSTGPITMGLWALALLFYLVAAVFLFARVSRAFMFFFLGFAADVAVWALSKYTNPAYNEAFSADALQLDYAILGALFVMLLITFGITRGWRED